MRYTPSITPLSATNTDEVEVKPVNYLRAARVVGERSLTPLVFPRHRAAQKTAPIPDDPPSVERRNGRERRNISRRIRHTGASLYDTRAPDERRSSNRRESDLTTRIEEKA